MPKVKSKPATEQEPDITPRQERIARALCASQGLKPDAMWPNTDHAQRSPAWRWQVKAAIAVEAAYEEPS